jgi:DNA-binding MarR family transcriptional regulator
MTYQVPRMSLAESDAWLGLMRICQLLPTALDAQLQANAQLTHFEFMVLSSLQLAPEKTMRMTDLARSTNATLPRLSHVATRLSARGFVERMPCEDDKRATNLRLTSEGRSALVRAIPLHIAQARELVIDALSPEQLDHLTAITLAIDARLAMEPGARLGLMAHPSPSRPTSAPANDH